MNSKELNDYEGCDCSRRDYPKSHLPLAEVLVQSSRFACNTVKTCYYAVLTWMICSNSEASATESVTDALVDMITRLLT